jgi:hypothetical protein
VAHDERFHGSNATDSPFITRTGESALPSPRRGMSLPEQPHTFREFDSCGARGVAHCGQCGPAGGG